MDQVDYEEMLPERLIDQIKGVIYGNCIGDAIGLLTEFMTKAQARMVRTSSVKLYFVIELSGTQ